MDNIWSLRNKIVHEAFTPNIDNFVSGTLKIFKEHCDAWDNKQVNESHSWRATPRDHYTLTFDVVVRSSGHNNNHMQVRGGLFNICPNQIHPKSESKPGRSYSNAHMSHGSQGKTD